MSRRLGFRAAPLSALVWLAACDLSGGRCKTDLPGTCPPVPPTWADVEPIVDRSCALCHVNGGQVSRLPLDSYDAVFALRRASAAQVHACAMPRDGVVLSDDDRRTLLTWFLCNAPR